MTKSFAELVFSKITQFCVALYAAIVGYELTIHLCDLMVDEVKCVQDPAEMLNSPTFTKFANLHETFAF